MKFTFQQTKWDGHVTRMDAERLVKISRDNIPAGRTSPGRPTRRWSDLIPDKNRWYRLQQRKGRRQTMQSRYNVMKN